MNFNKAEGKENSEKEKKSLKTASIFFTMAIHILKEVTD